MLSSLALVQQEPGPLPVWLIPLRIVHFDAARQSWGSHLLSIRGPGVTLCVIA